MMRSFESDAGRASGARRGETSMKRFRIAGVLVAVAGLALMATPAALSAPAKQLKILGHFNPGVGANADVVAHRGHAYLGSWIGNDCMSNGVRILDLKNPRSPQHVGTFADAASEPDLAGTWTEKIGVRHVRSKAFKGDLAVTSVQACTTSSSAVRGFALYDVTDPANPQRLSLVETEPQTRGSHEIYMETRGNKAYVYTAVISSEHLTSPDGVTPGNPDFRIYDVSDPRNPVQVGGWGAWAELGVHPMSGPPGLNRNHVHSVIVDGNARRAYLSYWDLGTVILDITDPTDPKFLGRTSFQPGEVGNAHSAWTAKGGKILVQTHESFGAPGSPNVGVPSIWDISNPMSPIRLSTFSRPEFIDLGETVHDPKVRGNTLYLSWYQEGVVKLDISRPASPKLLSQTVPPAYFTNPDWSLCVGPPPCSSIWGVYIHRNYVLASDEAQGLWILKR